MELNSNDELNLEAVLPTFNIKDSYLLAYEVHLNSYCKESGSGRGKGLAAFYNENKFTVSHAFSDELLQISVFESEDLCVIGIYRSSSDRNLGIVLANVIPKFGSCLIIGDLNICSKASSKHFFLESLRQRGFKLLTNEATHWDGGALDQAWLRKAPDVTKIATIEVYSPLFNCKDHDAILFTFGTEKSKFSLFYYFLTFLSRI